MNEKTKCKRCGLLIDSELEICPYCGTSTKIEEIKKDHSSSISDLEKVAQVKEKKKEKSSFFDFPSHVLEVPFITNIIYFLTGFIGLAIITFLFQIIASANGNFYFLHSSASSAAINFAVYFIAFGIMVFISLPHIKKFFEAYKEHNVVLWGLLGGFAVLVITSTVTSLFNLIPHQGQNANEDSLNSFTIAYPVLSIIAFGILGPIVEEITYRVGLFSLLYKKNRLLAYLVTTVIFGLIHFSFDAGNLVNEFINLPTYLTAGLLFCYIYEFKGFGASTIAHITNNLVALTFTLIASYIS